MVVTKAEKWTLSSREIRYWKWLERLQCRDFKASQPIWCVADARRPEDVHNEDGSRLLTRLQKCKVEDGVLISSDLSGI
ncbi:hypothetical protein Leryth_017980 [Lithospermum erythrorhizon]|nr:hypothetical protein Leryth_017980 [Lithospermum erythrorhizon]